MRHLRAGRLIELASGLWAVDATQPAAAVLDPVTGQVRTVVSWAELPPGPPGEASPLARVLEDGSSLWVQQDPSGPLVSVGPHGVKAAVWTNGLMLAACGPEVAWCASVPPGQELVHGPDAQPERKPHPDQLLQVAADGRCTTLGVEGSIRWVQAEPDALLLEVDTEPWHLEHLGAGTYEVVWSTRWLRLPWDADVPPMLSVHAYGLPPSEVPTRRYDDGGHFEAAWHEPDTAPPMIVGGRPWHVGWSSQTSAARVGQWRGVVASAHDDRGVLVRRWALGEGVVLAATSVGRGLAVAVAREPWTLCHDPGPVDVLIIDPAPDGVRTLVAGDSVDITQHVWPLVPRPLDADSYAQQVLTANSSLENYWQDETGARAPLVRGMSHVRTGLTGEWPGTHLEWTFEFDRHPGLVLRRHVPLFDELGRITEPEHAAIHLMEDLDTAALPPASAAREGILDI